MKFAVDRINYLLVTLDLSSTASNWQKKNLLIFKKYENLADGWMMSFYILATSFSLTLPSGESLYTRYLIGFSYCYIFCGYPWSPVTNEPTVPMPQVILPLLCIFTFTSTKERFACMSFIKADSTNVLKNINQPIGLAT